MCRDAAIVFDASVDCMVQGYPGKLEVTVTYELMRNLPELRITFTATTDQPTPGGALAGF